MNTSSRRILSLSAILLGAASIVVFPSPGLAVGCSTWSALASTINSEVSSSSVASTLMSIVSVLSSTESSDCGAYVQANLDMADALSSFYEAEEITETELSAVSDCFTEVVHNHLACDTDAGKWELGKQYCDRHQDGCYEDDDYDCIQWFSWDDVTNTWCATFDRD